MRRIGTSPTPLAALVILGCASAATTAYVAPTRDTIIPDVEVTQGNLPAQTIFMINRSTVPVRIYSLTLRSCRNVAIRCEAPIPLDVRVGPGSRVRIQRVEPQDRRESFTFGYSYGWRADSGGIAALSALADGGSEEARNRLLAIQRAEEALSPQPGISDERLGIAEVNALGDRVAGIVTEPESLSMRVGESIRLDQIRLMVIGQSGERLGRFRGFRFRVHQGLKLIPPDTIRAVTAGGTLLEFTLPDGALPDRPKPLAPARLTVIVRE